MIQQSMLQRLAARLNGLQKRIRDLEHFKMYLRGDQPKFFTIAVSGVHDSEGNFIADKYFSIELNPDSTSRIASLAEGAKQGLSNEIGIAKNEMRKLLDE
jgi:hypothetical protein